MESIKEGDNVWLKGQATSPKMTVQEAQNGWATCIWFDVEGKYNAKDFKVSSLTKEDPIKR